MRPVSRILLRRRAHHQVQQVRAIATKTTTRNLAGASAPIDDKDELSPLPLMPRKIIQTDMRGRQVITDPFLNKGTAFTPNERERLGLRGLVPPCHFDVHTQEARILQRLKRTEHAIDKHHLLTELMDRNTILFYKVFMNNIKHLMPIVYTPTVGKACLEHHHMYNRSKGMYFTAADRGNFVSMVYNWPEDDVEVIVVTDGGRILALGDLGSNGMNIPIGKLALYTAAGGINPRRTLPIVIDVGTDNVQLRNDPIYNGLKIPRIQGAQYWDIIDEFMRAVKTRWPNTLVQFEDFTSTVALPMLNKYRHATLCFNDDIQSTGTIALATILASLRTRRLLPNQLVNERIVCVGAGSAGLGVCNAIVDAMVDDGISRQQALRNFYLFDQHGILAPGRKPEHQFSEAAAEFARDDVNGTLEEVVAKVKPTVLLGLSAAKGAFTEAAVREMARHVQKPVILPLSNPTNHAECTAEEAFQWTDGRAIFASGSPFADVQLPGGKLGITNQCNNAFSFPGIGLACQAFQISRISDAMMLKAARTISQLVPEHQVLDGKLLPDIDQLRDVSVHVAAQIVKVANNQGLLKKGTHDVHLLDDDSLLRYLKSNMWIPEYNDIVPSA